MEFGFYCRKIYLFCSNVILIQMLCRFIFLSISKIAKLYDCYPENSEIYASLYNLKLIKKIIFNFFQSKIKKQTICFTDSFNISDILQKYAIFSTSAPTILNRNLYLI